MPVGLLTLDIHIPGCTSLKEKRSRIKPLIARLRREFNISVAEMDHLDSWQEAVIACAVVSNDAGQTRKVLQRITDWIETYWPDLDIAGEEIVIL